MAVATMTPARALRRPRRTDPRALVGIFLTLAALAGSVAYWVGASDARPVVIATRALPAGATLHRSDLGVAYVRVDDAVYGAALSSEGLDSLVGRELGEPIHAQQILARAQVADRLGLAADQVAITIPARPESAVDGRLRPDDSVQVLVTTTTTTTSDKTRNEVHTRVVLEHARVFEVGRDQAFSGSGSGSGSNSSLTSDADSGIRGSITSVTLAVTADEARQLAEARRSGELDVLLLPPSVTEHAPGA